MGIVRRLPILLWASAVLVTSSGPCPDNCICTAQRNRYYEVDCRNRYLNTLPSMLPEYSEEIDMSENTIIGVTDESFESWPDSVKMLDLSYNRISHISSHAFIPLKKLKHLYLKFNYISHVSHVMFPFSLKHLSLENNNLDPNAPIVAPGLETLDLTNCGVSNLPENIKYLQPIKNLFISCKEKDELRLQLDIRCSSKRADRITTTPIPPSTQAVGKMFEIMQNLITNVSLNTKCDSCCATPETQTYSPTLNEQIENTVEHTFTMLVLGFVIPSAILSFILGAALGAFITYYKLTSHYKPLPKNQPHDESTSLRQHQ